MTRDKSLDIARGISIIFIVCVHCDLWGYLSHFVLLFSIAVFIFISGYLFKDTEITTFNDFIKVSFKKVKKLYIFYLKYEIIFFLLKNFFLNIGLLSTNIDYSGKILTYNNSIKDYIIGIFKIIICMGREPFCGAFWFIISLIFITISFSFINYISNKINTKNKNLIRFSLSLLCFIIGMTMSYIDVINIKRLSPALTYTIIYYLGNYYYLNKNNIKIKFNNIFICILSFISLLILNNFGYIGANNNQYSNPIYFIVCSILGIYFVFYISKKMQNYKIFNFISYIGKNTLPIIGLHFISFKLVMFIQYIFGIISYEDIALLTGANSKNFWFILYMLAGVFIPLILNFVYIKIKGQLIKIYTNSRIIKE